MDHLETVWIAIAFILGLAVRQLGLPSLIGYLIAGFTLNALGLHGGPVLEHIAHLGVLLLMFLVGLKMQLGSFIQPVAWCSAFPHLMLVSGLLYLFIPWYGELTEASRWLLAITLGFSSTVMAAKVLEQKSELRSFHGRIAISVSVAQDLVALPLLGIVSGVTPSIWALLLFGLPFLRPLLHWLLEFSGHDELLILFGLLLAIDLGGLGFEFLGLSSEFGALVLGALIANHRRANELGDALWGLKEIFLIGFFLQIGMAGLPTFQMLGVALLFTLLLPIKALLFFLIFVAFRLRARSAFLTALSLSSYREFALIVADLAARQQWIGTDWVVLLALMVTLSFIVVAPINYNAHSLYERLEPYLSRFESRRRHPDEQPLALGNAGILIMGMGRVGSGAYDVLTDRHIRVVGLDSDPDQVSRHLHEGRRVLYADSEDPFFWQHLNINKLQGILLAIPDPEAKQIAITQLRRRGYKGLICAIITYDEEAEAILKAGGDIAFNHYSEAGLGFAERVWEALHHDELNILLLNKQK